MARDLRRRCVGSSTYKRLYAYKSTKMLFLKDDTEFSHLIFSGRSLMISLGARKVSLSNLCVKIWAEEQTKDDTSEDLRGQKSHTGLSGLYK